MLIHEGYSVKHVMNITDVGHLVGDESIGEDKISAEAKLEGKTPGQIISFYTKSFFDDLKKLNVLQPDITPRATDHIEDMLNLMESLEQKGYLYRTGTGIYFDTSRFKDYGSLTGMNFKSLNESLISGARVKRDPETRNTTDFAVWRFSKNDSYRLWDSEWGKGFPGWHIECSAMSMRYLGETLDMHCGGVDHIPIHHTNEIAQSEAATGKKFSRHWFHVEFLTVEGKKMSKSLRNVYTAEDVLSRGFSSMALRYFLISGNYRQKLNFTFDAMKGAQNTLFGIYEFLARLSDAKKISSTEPNSEFKKYADKSISAFFEALEDDLDMPMALSAMHSFIKEATMLIESRQLSGEGAVKAIDTMLEFDSILGLGLSGYLEEAGKEMPRGAAELFEEREEARRRKDFRRSDELRKELYERYNIIVEDQKEGARWHYRA